MTIDHFQPKTQGGTDDLANLIYCCVRCNLYKADYWPMKPDDPSLWNPRTTPARDHFLPTAEGLLVPLTPIGDFTLRRLRLNRPLLVAFRLRKLRGAEEKRLLSRYRDLLRMLDELQGQQARLLEERRLLLEEQKRLLQLLLEEKQKE